MPYIFSTLLPIFYPHNLHDSSYKQVFISREDNGFDPDQLASPADLDLHCFQNRKYPSSAWLGLTLACWIIFKLFKKLFQEHYQCQTV